MALSTPEERRAPELALAPDGTGLAAWETATGDPVEVALRDARGAWTPAAAMSGPFGARPGVAALPGGRAALVWEAPAAAGGTAVHARLHDGRAWGADRVLGTGAGAPPRPVVAAAGEGFVVAWADRDGVRLRTLAGGGGDATRTVAPPRGAAREVAVAAAPGLVAVAWLEIRGDHRVVRARLRRDGRWTPAADLSAAAGRASQPQVAASRRGALVAWRSDRGDRDQVVEAALWRRGGGWLREVLGPPAGRARGLPRTPGPVPLGPRAALAGERAAVAWPQRRGGRDEVRIALHDGRAWTPPERVPSPGEAGAPDIVPAADGGLVLALEELDGVDLALRVRRRDASGVWACCVRLTPRGEEGALPRLGGTGRAAVWNATNRGGIGAAGVACA